MKKKILVVEDDKNINFIYKDILGDKYEVTYVDTAEKARNEIKNKKYHLMILDIILPGKSGDLFFKELKKSPKFDKLEIIVISILSDAIGNLDKIDSNITCIQKPFNKDNLLVHIEEKLGK